MTPRYSDYPLCRLEVGEYSGRDRGDQPCSRTVADKLFIDPGRDLSVCLPSYSGEGLLNNTFNATAPWDRFGGAPSQSGSSLNARLRSTVEPARPSTSTCLPAALTR